MQHLPDQTAPRALVEMMTPAFDAVAAMAQPSDEALEVVAGQADALATLDPLWRAFLVR